VRGNSAKSTVAFLLLLMTGIVLGGLIGELTSGIPYLSWLSYGKTFGIAASSPMVLDLWVIKLVFGLELRMTVCVILGLIAAIIIYKKVL